MQIKSLHSSYNKLHKKHGAKKFVPIYGAGKIFSPRVMFIFMNPTGKNISASPSWRGIRAPWLGTKNIWKLFFAIGVISKKTHDDIQVMFPNEWTPSFSAKLYKEVAKNGVFITNLAKCTQEDARKLRDGVFRDYLSVMHKEIIAVNPASIVSFGSQVSSILLGKPISISAYSGRKNEKIVLGKRFFRVYPVYYPVGQGMRNMEKATNRIRKII